MIKMDLPDQAFGLNVVVGVDIVRGGHQADLWFLRWNTEL